MSKTPWPPQHLAPILSRMHVWSAWYAGDRGMLTAAADADVMSSAGSGVIGMIVNAWKNFWGTSIAESTGRGQATLKTHIPLATDIARTSADNMIADPPRLTSEDEPTQIRLTQFVDDGIMTTLRSAFEMCAALGGVFLKVMVDYGKQECTIVKVDADKADPSFAWGKLAKVRFWQIVGRTTTQVWRHIETHDLDPVTGNGRVLHELFMGKDDDLGDLVSFEGFDWYFSEIVKLIDPETGYIDTETEGLDVVYIPNVVPNPLWRNVPAGEPLGAPDIQGSEDLLDRLDHIRSSLLREVELGVARIMVPDFMMQDMGAGRGLAFDTSQAVFSQLHMPPTADGAAASIQMFQPEIRVDAYQAIEQRIVKDILRNAGYSADSFGDRDAGSSAATATEINSRDRRTRITRGNKIRLSQPALEYILWKAMMIEIHYGWILGAPETIEVSFPADIKMTFAEAAQSVSMLLLAGAISKEVGVRMLHPDWDDDQLNDEIIRLYAEQGVTITDPDEIGRVVAEQKVEDGSEPV